MVDDVLYVTAQGRRRLSTDQGGMLRKDIRDSVWVAEMSGSSIFYGYRNVDIKPWTVFMSLNSQCLCVCKIFSDIMTLWESQKRTDSYSHWIIM